MAGAGGGAPAGANVAGDHRGRAAEPDHDRPARGAQRPVLHVYGLTETYGPYSVCPWQEGWEDLDVEERAVLLSRQGVGMIHAERLRVVDDDMRRRAGATARRWARSSCAATT